MLEPVTRHSLIDQLLTHPNSPDQTNQSEILSLLKTTKHPDLLKLLDYTTMLANSVLSNTLCVSELTLYVHEEGERAE